MTPCMQVMFTIDDPCDVVQFARQPKPEASIAGGRGQFPPVPSAVRGQGESMQLCSVATPLMHVVRGAFSE